MMRAGLEGVEELQLDVFELELGSCKTMKLVTLNHC